MEVLLELPFEYQQQIDSKNQENTASSTALNPGDSDGKIQKLIERLKNKDKTTFMLVAYPEFTPLNEGLRAMKDLERVGITIQGVFLNNIINETDCPDDFSRERWKLQQHYLHNAKELFGDKPLFKIPLYQHEIIGLTAIKYLSENIFTDNLYKHKTSLV